MIEYSAQVNAMCPITKGPKHGPAPIPEEGQWVKAYKIEDISGYTHGVGWCAPQQGTCKLSLNIENGLPVGAGLDDLGKGLRSMTGTIFSTKAKGVRYLELTEGYILKTALDKDNQVIGYQFVRLGKMMEDIRHGKDPKEAYEKNIGTYGRFSAEQGAVKYIDPREE